MTTCKPRTSINAQALVDARAAHDSFIRKKTNLGFNFIVRDRFVSPLRARFGVNAGQRSRVGEDGSPSRVPTRCLIQGLMVQSSR